MGKLIVIAVRSSYYSKVKTIYYFFTENYIQKFRYRKTVYKIKVSYRIIHNFCVSKALYT